MKILDQETRDELIRFTRRLIQTSSLCGEERGVAELVQAEMLKLGYDDVTIDRMGNILGKIEGTGRHTLFLLGHMDHVEPGEMKEPYSGRILDGAMFGVTGDVIYGRGASDMKGADAAMIYGAALAKRTQNNLGGTIIVALTVKEEEGRGEGIRYILENANLDIDTSLCGEASHLDTYLGHRGKLQFRITVKGRTAHASNPSQGVNAIYKMESFLGLLQKEYRPPRHDVLGQCTYAVINISSHPGGDTPIIPDTCIIDLDRRYLPSETPERVEEEIKELLYKIRDNDHQFKADIELTKNMPAMYCNPKKQDCRRILEALQRARRRVTGEEGKIGAWLFATEGAYLTAKGIPCIGFGPGDERFAHTPQDHVSINDLITAAHVYEGFVGEILGHH